MELHRRAVPDGYQFRLTIFKSEVTIWIIQVLTPYTIDNLKLITLSLLDDIETPRLILASWLSSWL